jgi:hypothetical protein
MTNPHPLAEFVTQLYRALPSPCLRSPCAFSTDQFRLTNYVISVTALPHLHKKHAKFVHKSARRIVPSCLFNRFYFLSEVSVRSGSAGRMEDPGVTLGQSDALASASICLGVQVFPRFIPWQCTADLFQTFWLARFSFQNGQVRHCSGRAAYTAHVRRECTTALSPFALGAGVSRRNIQSYCPREFRSSSSAHRPLTRRQ